MIANVSAHRRANAFAQALEEQSARDAAAEQPEDRLRPRLPRTGPGRAAAGPRDRSRRAAEAEAGPRGQGRAASPARRRDGGHAAGRHAAGGEAADPAVPEQRSHRAGAPTGRPRWGSCARVPLVTKGLAAGGLTVGVAAGAFGGVAAASSDALPGDSLYGLKRGMEDLKLGLADGDADRGELYLDQASTRLSEARRLMERGRGGHLDHESAGRDPPRPVRHAARRLRGPPPAPRGVRAGRLARPDPGALLLLPARTARPGAACATGCPSSSATSASRSSRSSTP